jgi:hypothetical protein
MPLILIDDNEAHLCPTWLHDDVTPATDNHGSSTFVHNRDESHVVDEIHVQEERDFSLREASLGGEEPSIE